MGLRKAKSLLPVRKGLTFLDITARQAIAQGTALVLMNSFATSKDSLRLLAGYPELDTDLPQAFVQHRIPKVRQSDLAPADCPDNPQLEWCPPGHGDIYASLYTTGMLELLLDRGYRYAFISNADNLGASIDWGILGYIIEHKLPFLMEVAQRMSSDKKGGHLARDRDGNLDT